MPISMEALADDLVAESVDLRALLAPLDEPGWRRDTPAVGWTVLDQVTHLAHFDDVAVRSATEPDAFRAEVERAVADGGIDPDAIAQGYRSRTGADVLGWFDASRARLVEVFRGLEPGVRVPWFGAPMRELASASSTQSVARSADRAQRGTAMSAASSLTARIMETWAHGQDVADAVGVVREPTDRLRHVAHIGIGARAFSYAVHGREVPTTPVRVELVAPSGALWTWGAEDAADRVTGAALDFCLAVTQRRHRDDTALEIDGPVAQEWMTIAQAFAGAAGTGRTAGEFA